MNLFRRLGAVLPGAKDQRPAEVEDDPGGFGPPGGLVWTTPSDVLSDRPKGAPAPAPDLPAVNGHPAPAVNGHPAPAEELAALEPEMASLAQALAAPGPSDGSTDIAATADIAGFLGSCLVDSDSGLMLASEGGGTVDLEAAAALNTQVVRAEHEVIEALRLDDRVEDILITMTSQLHFIRPLEASPSVFLYVCLDKKAANLGMARMQVNKIESGLRL